MGNRTFLAESDINGFGLFTFFNLVEGQRICLIADLSKRLSVNVEDKDWITIEGMHVNHQTNGNTYAKVKGDLIYLYALKDIEAFQELTSDYKKAPPVFDRKTEGFLEIK